MISLVQVQGGQEELSEIQEMDKVENIDENLHNFLIWYQTHKILSSLEILLKGLCDTIVTRGYEKFLIMSKGSLWGYMVSIYVYMAKWRRSYLT